jgi:hypothetical protein
MKVGDLVRCKHLHTSTGIKPLGIVMSEPRYGISVGTVDVLVTTGSGYHAGQVLPFRVNSLEIVK